jgi:hypothetical protein
MAELKYATGEEVRIGDIIDLDKGHGPHMRVVVIIPTRKAAEGFNAVEWEYLKQGVMLQDTKLFGLLHLDELDKEHALISRAQ